MTQQSIKWNELTPRERDALVAELIFGWTKSKTNTNNWFEPISGLWKPVDNITVLPHFTTHIEDAWQVAEKLERDGFLFETWNSVGAGYSACFVRVGRYSANYIPTAPEAICIAALRAVGCEVVTE